MTASPEALDVGAYLARFDGPFTGKVATREHDSRPSSKAQQKVRHLYCYGLTILIKHLALQIFTLRIKKSDGPFRFATPDWRSASIQIYPSEKSIQWPPRLSLDDDGFEVFATRWDNLKVMW